MIVFGIVTPYSILGVYESFERTFHFHLQATNHKTVQHDNPEYCDLHLTTAETLYLNV
jgi:hypothetical protein